MFSNLLYQHLQTSAVRVGFDLELFELLGASESPLNVMDLAESTAAGRLLLGSEACPPFC